jgi:hypothetical protein
MKYSAAQLQKAMQALELLESASGTKETGYKHDLTPAAGVSPYVHGNGGLFSTPGVDARVFSAMNLPMGLLNELPVMPAGSAAPPGNEYGGYSSPLYDTITGVTAGNLDSSANQPEAPCDDPPYAGLTKLCTLVAPYGRFSGRIRPVDITQAAMISNRGEPVDLRLVNNPLNQAGFLRSTAFGMMPNQFINELNMRLFEGATGFVRMVMPKAFTGNPANNNAGGGYKEPMGLDLLINTGNKVDAITSSVCTALNSDVKDFNYTLVNASSGASIEEYITTIYNYLRWNAEQQGLAPVTYKISMRPELFMELVKVWSVRQYEDALLAVNIYTNGRGMVDVRAATESRDSMWRERFLPIFGDVVPVVLDNTIAEKTNVTNAQIPAGSYASDIYFVPMTVLGGVPVTWLETFNFDASNLRDFVDFAGIEPSAFTTTDGGRFLWWRHRTNTCIDLRWLTMFRIIMRTPQLAGRLQNVRYSPLQHFADWQTTSSYHFNGGRTTSPISSFYTPWSTSEPVVVG